MPASVESHSYCFSQANHAEFYKPYAAARILQDQISALAVGRVIEPRKIRFPNSRMRIVELEYVLRRLAFFLYLHILCLISVHFPE
jgi:hypothetical protein